MMVSCLFAIMAGAVGAMELNSSIEASYMSKYMWHGFEVYGSRSASSLDFTVELDDSGFYFGAQYITPNGSGNVNSRYFNEEDPDIVSVSDMAKYIYYGGYMVSLFDGEVFKTDIDIRYQYHDYYKMSSQVLDQQEASLFAQWTEILPYGFSPYYKATYVWDGNRGTRKQLMLDPGFPPTWSYEGNDRNSHLRGWLHLVGLALDVPLDMPEIGMSSIRFTVDTEYNDGVVGTQDITRGGGSEFTHMTWGAETELQAGPGSLSLGLFYQHALADDYVYINNTFYSTIAYKLMF